MKTEKRHWRERESNLSDSGNHLAYECDDVRLRHIELKNPLPERVLRNGDEIVHQTGGFSNRLILELNLIFHLCG
jgi:hypothetical protein